MTNTSSPVVDRVDPINLGIMASRLDSITREMTNTMLRTARSTTMAARDFSCSITSSEHDLLSAPGGIPVHVYGSSLIAQSMQDMHPEFRVGDAFLHNDPYMGNTHAADHTLVVPVFFEGEHVFTAMAKAHQVDIGNSRPTTYMPSAKDVYEEGGLIFPCVRVQSDYQDVSDVIGMARRRIRAFETWYGDYLASLGAVRLAERRLQEFCRSFPSIGHVRAFVRDWLDYSERMAAAGIATLPAGELTVSSKMDAFPGLPDGLDLNAGIRVMPEEGRVVIDLRDNPDCTPTGLNLTEASSMNSAVMAILMALNTDKSSRALRVPNNSGSHRRIEVLVRENCVAGIPRHPASCSTATRTVTDRLALMVLTGLADMSEGRFGSAEAGLGSPPHEAVVSGLDSRRNDEEFLLQIFAGSSGGPGTAEGDGWLSFTNIMGAGIIHIDASEIVEQRYPLVIWQHASVRTDSEGAGEFRGAPGTIAAYGPRAGAIESHYYMEGVVNRPKGVRGGGIAEGPQAWRITSNATAERIDDTVAEIALVGGEAIASLGSGAGGFGSPLRRSSAAVLEDVVDEYISLDRARQAYGVVIVGDESRWETLTVDEEATTSLRAQLAADARSGFDGGRTEWDAPVWWTGR